MITKKSKVKKTPEQIMQANLRKMLGKLKTEVADREELWVEFFQEVIMILVGKDEYKIKGSSCKDVVTEGEILAETMLQAYEARWGKV